MKGFLDAAIGLPSSCWMNSEQVGSGTGGAWCFEGDEHGAFAVITTHYANIKTRAAQLPEAINGSITV